MKEAGLVTSNILVTIIVLSVPLSLPLLAAGPPTYVFSPGEKPYGLTYEEHAKNFFKWLISIPSDDNPMNDETGEKCANGQLNSNSSVFYLSGGGGGKFERTCTVPAGKGLLVPVLVVEVSDKESPGASVDELHVAAKQDQDGVTSLYLKVDDQEYGYEDLLKYRIHTDPFQVVFPKNGVFGVVDGGPSTAVADGFYILTKPLSKGNHTAQFKSSLGSPSYASEGYYHLNVQ
jgi:hypothetical protein